MQGPSEGSRSARQVDSPVLWVEGVRRLVNEGVKTIVEVGPGRVLSGLARRVDRSLKVLSVEDPAGLEKLEAKLGGTE